MWGALQSRGVTGGGEGVVEATARVPAGSRAVSRVQPRNPACFCRKVQRVIRAEVYWKSTGDSGLGKSAGKCRSRRDGVTAPECCSWHCLSGHREGSNRGAVVVGTSQIDQLPYPCGSICLPHSGPSVRQQGELRVAGQKRTSTVQTVGTVPPSITYSVPVIEAARGEARKVMSSATSVGFAGRPSGIPPSPFMMICLPPS